MQISLTHTSVFAQTLPAIVIYTFEDEPLPLPVSLKQRLKHLTNKEFKGSDSQTLLLHTDRLPGIRTPRLLLVGLGKRAKLNPEKIRRATGTAVKRLTAAGITDAALQIRPDTGSNSLAATIEAALLASYRFTKFKSPDDSHAALQTLTLCLPKSTNLTTAQRILARTQTIINAANYAREISNLPGNFVWPAILAQYARQAAAELGLTCTVLDKAALEAGGYGGLLAVGAGSIREPHLIVLEYKPRSTPKNSKPIALVGKAITFDSGGISIKPSDKMDEMKFDKSGGAAVLATMRAIAVLKLPLHVVGIIAAAENMPGGRSYRPGDIVTSYKGKDKRAVTIEVLNTDAEGRIILGDALVHARERNARAIIDLATLTGACVVALGTHAAGLLGNDDKLLETIRAHGERTGERCWPLPLWPEYKEMVKSDVADHKNTGGRYGGTSTAAAFLAKYVGETPWAHIDIAGTAWATEEKPYLAKGATGFGVRLLLDLLQNWK